MIKYPISCDLIGLYDLLGKKWTMIILHNIEDNPISFNELEKIFRGGINPTLLSQRIKELAKYKILEQKIISKRIYYVLSAEGIKLKILLHNIKDWSMACKLKIPDKCLSGKCLCREYFQNT